MRSSFVISSKNLRLNSHPSGEIYLFAGPLAQLARLWSVEMEVAGFNLGGTRSPGLKFPDNIMMPVFKILFNLGDRFTGLLRSVAGLVSFIRTHIQTLDRIKIREAPLKGH